MLPAIRKALPRLELRLYEYQTAPMLEKLHGGELDLGILALPVELAGLESRELYREPFLVALPAQHPLARARQRAGRRPQERAAAAAGGRPLPARPGAGGVQPRRRARGPQDFRATSLETLRQMVAAGAGVTLLPELAGRGAYRNASGVVLRPFTRPAPARRIGALWRKSTARQPAIDALARLIAEHAR